MSRRVRQRSPFRLAALLALSLAQPGLARANIAELFGLGASASARSGAVSALVDDWAAAHYNPAGLAFGQGHRVSVGFQGAGATLKINGKSRPVSEPYGVTVGASLPAPLTGWLAGKLNLGIALYVLPRNVLRVNSRLPTDEFFPYYDNRGQRLVVLPALAVRVHPRLALGVAVNFLAGLGGAVLTESGQTRALEPRVDVPVFSTARLNAGARVDLGHRLQGALVYRQAFSVPFTVRTHNTVAGDKIDLDLTAEGLYTPGTLVGGVAWRAPERMSFALDLSWARWSSYKGPFVQVSSRIPFVGAVAGQLPKVGFNDAFGARAGAELRALTRPQLALDLRTGFALETSPVPAQSGITNMVDGTKLAFTLGAGLRIGSAAGHPITLDFSAGLHLVRAVSSQKRVFQRGEMGEPEQGLRDEVPDSAADPTTMGLQISNPGYPSVGGSGHLLSGALTLGVAL